MAKTWALAPTPCVGVCKFDDDGRCLGCGMTKREKKASKTLRGKAQKRPFFELLVARLGELRRLRYWSRMYRRKCDRKGAPCPLDKLGVGEDPAYAGAKTPMQGS